MPNLETHDEVLEGRVPRLARLADGNDPRSWYARSRSRVATGLLLTAPGTPMLFMGQEFLEDKPWSDDVYHHPHLRLHWAGVEPPSGQIGDRHMIDFRRCVRELIHLRHRLPALRADGFRVFHVHDANRVLAFHRWVPGEGRDVVVVANLSEHTWLDYQLGLPRSGRWEEAFNSDVYDHWVNPWAQGNGGQPSPAPDRCTASTSGRASSCRPMHCWYSRFEPGRMECRRLACGACGEDPVGTARLRPSSRPSSRPTIAAALGALGEGRPTDFR